MRFQTESSEGKSIELYVTDVTEENVNDQDVSDDDVSQQEVTEEQPNDQGEADPGVDNQPQAEADSRDQAEDDQYFSDQEISAENSDQLEIRHSDGRLEKIPIPEGDGVILRVGRELDNDVILTDPRSSRYHAEIRRAGSIMEIKDLESANGTIINESPIEPQTWTKLAPGQSVKMAETQLRWEKSVMTQATVAMKRQRADTRVTAVPPPTAGPR